MTQVCLLDSVRLSELLKEALEWNSTVESILVSAANGSILATAFRHETPDIKDLRTLSTTITAAYTVASEDVLVFEAQATRALSVIVPVADHILLAVNGPPQGEPGENRERAVINGDQYEEHDEDTSQEEEADTEQTAEQEQTRSDLESVAEELANILRKELAGLSWPHDI